MHSTKERNGQTRERVLDAAGRAFRVHGYAGVGVDALARAAGVTSGAFYGHFRSKADAFGAAALDGLRRLRAGVERARARCGDGWLEALAGFYLGAEHRRDTAGGCALPSLSADVARADEATRGAPDAAREAEADAVIPVSPALDDSPSGGA